MQLTTLAAVLNREDDLILVDGHSLVREKVRIGADIWSMSVVSPLFIGKDAPCARDKVPRR
jgi:hypothetical protein